MVLIFFFKAFERTYSYKPGVVKVKRGEYPRYSLLGTGRNLWDQ